MIDKPSTLATVLAEQISAVASGVDSTLKRHLSKMASPVALSRNTQADVRKRVPPKVLGNYLTAEKAIGLLTLEIETIGTRISSYQFIERYREHFKPANKNMATSFVVHTHALRGSEVYIVMEQCSACLTFFGDLATDLGLFATNNSKALEKAFKSTFERHLRERHRIVHAHERPSLTSRVIGTPAHDIRKEEFKDALGEIFGSLASKLFEIAPHLKADTYEETIKKINDSRLQAVDDECFEMWSIFLDNITKTIDPSRLLK